MPYDFYSLISVHIAKVAGMIEYNLGNIVSYHLPRKLFAEIIYVFRVTSTLFAKQEHLLNGNLFYGHDNTWNPQEMGRNICFTLFVIWTFS